MFELKLGKDKSAAIKVVVDEDGGSQLSGVYYSGNGSEADRVWASASDMVGPSMAVRDARRSATDERNKTRLGYIAATDLRMHRSPIEQWSLTVSASQVHRDLMYPRGTVRVEVIGDVWLEDEQVDFMIVAASTDIASEHVDLEVQKVD